MKLTEWMSSAEMGLRPITHFNERQSSPHSFLQLIWRAVADSAINWFHSFTYRASAWSPVHCFLFFSAPSTLHFISCWLPLKKEEKQFTLSFVVVEWIQWLVSCLRSLSFSRSVAAAAAPNPLKERKTNQPSLHSPTKRWRSCLHNFQFFFNFINH